VTAGPDARVPNACRRDSRWTPPELLAPVSRHCMRAHCLPLKESRYRDRAGLCADGNAVLVAPLLVRSVLPVHCKSVGCRCAWGTSGDHT